MTTITSILYADVWTCMIKHLAEMFLEIEMFQTVILENIKPQILCPIKLFPKIVPFMR